MQAVKGRLAVRSTHAGQREGARHRQSDHDGDSDSGSDQGSASDADCGNVTIVMGGEPSSAAETPEDKSEPAPPTGAVGLRGFRQRARRVVHVQRTLQCATDANLAGPQDLERMWRVGVPPGMASAAAAGEAPAAAAPPSATPITAPTAVHDPPGLCNITVCDISQKRCAIHHHIRSAGSLEAFLVEPRPAWSQVRWINVRGLSHAVVASLCAHFNVHDLVREDLLHVPQRIKADFYEGLLYVSMSLVTLKSGSGADVLADSTSVVGYSPDVEHYDHFGDLGGSTAGSVSEEKAEKASLAGNSSVPPAVPAAAVAKKSNKKRTRRGVRRLWHAALGVKHVEKTMQLRDAQHASSLAAARHRERVGVEQVSVLLLRDAPEQWNGTVISFFEVSGQPVTLPLLKRLSSARTVLRGSEDASYLVSALVDAVIDHMLPVMTAYSADIENYEYLCLHSPQRASITDLHLLRGELRILRQVLEPTQYLVHALRNRGRDANAENPFGTVSALARTYFSDVADHINTVVENIEALIVECTDLIDLVFNTISRSSNDSMKALTITSILILPLSFCSSIFGTNFTSVGLYNDPNGFLVFWMICVGVTILFVCVLRFLPMITRQGS